MTPTISSDENAYFKRVVLPYLDDAYELARWLAGNRADAEDIVQEACLRAFRGIGSFSGGNARSWVQTIVRHTAYSWLQKNRPTAIVHVVDLEGVGGVCPSEADDETPETALIAKDEAEQLEAMIAALPAPLRETIVLRDIQGFSYLEIAQMTGAPIGTVMSRLARARRTLLVTIGSKELMTAS
jgi:RNA polymerase sigma factor (sigma-70 family)